MKDEGVTAERKQPNPKPTPPSQLAAAKEDDEETIDDSHNWRGIAISLLVILAICSIIALAIILLTPKNTGGGEKGDRYSLAEIINRQAVPRTFNGSWISEEFLEFRDKDGHLVIYSARSKQVIKKLVDNITFAENNVEKYSISTDKKYVLLLYDILKMYRYSFHAKYKIYEVSTKKIYNLAPQGFPEAQLTLAMWGPKDNQLVYVYENNIYYVAQVNDTHYPITTTGIEGVIFNGVTDWLYEEEILSSNSAIWWEPDGNLLCFATFNDSKLGSLYYEYYGQHNDTDNVYPEMFYLRYPKPGKDNPSAFLWVVDLRNPSKILQRDVKPPREVQDQLVHVWFVNMLSLTNSFSIFLIYLSILLLAVEFYDHSLMPFNTPLVRILKLLCQKLRDTIPVMCKSTFYSDTSTQSDMDSMLSNICRFISRLTKDILLDNMLFNTILLARVLAGYGTGGTPHFS